MAYPSEDQPVRYPPVLSTLGKDHESIWRDTTHTEINRIKNGITDLDTFGDIPAARAFGRVYVAARRTYEATLTGLQEDLVAAGEALANAGAEMSRRDEDAGSAFVALNARWSSDAGFSSSQRHDEATQTEEVRDGARELVRIDQEAADASVDTGDQPAAVAVTTPDGATAPDVAPPEQRMDTGG
ncbi:MAG: hypothetical protein ABIQ61_08360 [Ornithinibacter sp.]